MYRRFVLVTSKYTKKYMIKLLAKIMDLILCLIINLKYNNTVTHKMPKTNPTQAPRVFVMYKLNSMSTMTANRNARKHFPRSGSFGKNSRESLVRRGGRNLCPPSASPIEGEEVVLRTTSGRGSGYITFRRVGEYTPSLVGDVWGDGCFGPKGFSIGDKNSTSIKREYRKRYPEKKTGCPNVDMILSRSSPCPGIGSNWELNDAVRGRNPHSIAIVYKWVLKYVRTAKRGYNHGECNLCYSKLLWFFREMVLKMRPLYKAYWICYGLVK